MRIEFEPHGGGTAFTEIDCHGVRVSMGNFTTLCLERFDIEIDGAKGLEELLAPLVKEARAYCLPGPVYSCDQWDAETARRNKVPEELARKVERIGLGIALKWFGENPDQFIEWAEKRDKEAERCGSDAKLEQIREALGIEE